jgi:hypothetical protein
VIDRLSTTYRLCVPTSPAAGLAKPITSAAAGLALVPLRDSTSPAAALNTNKNIHTSSNQRAILAALLECTGTKFDNEWASKVEKTILTGQSVGNPAAYLAECIRRDPQRYCPTYQPPPFNAETNR